MNAKAFRALVIIALCSLTAGASLAAWAQVRRARAQTLYVPVYSHIYYGDRERDYILLSATLSIRNTDPERSITLLSADYYNSKGKFLEKFVQAAVTLGPLETVRYIVKESDTRGGSGANFIVKWSAAAPVAVPIIEAVMIGARGQQGISFTSRGQAIQEQ
ncbi:MAG: DUF3124 domain-containing protein [Spirochaetes bacterium]|jgi:hypothetical protein|nr:DUF3124 domain-containing protein [Spirochaetota bacterium]